MGFLILPISTGLVLGEKLKCFECSEKDTQNDKKCSVNQTRYGEASADTGYFCRIWAIKDTAVHKSLVQSSSCEDETLKYNIANDIVGKFTGKGEAQALCCNWSLCNLNTTLAMLSEEPSSAMPLVMQSLSISLTAIINIVLFTQVVRCIV